MAVQAPPTSGAPVFVAEARQPAARGEARVWLVKTVVVAADLVAIALAMTIAIHLREAIIGRGGRVTATRDTLLGAISLPIWVAVFNRCRLYSSRHIASRLQEIRLLVSAVAFSVLGMAAASFLFEMPVARGWLAIVFFTSLFLLTAERELVRRGFLAMRRRGRLRRRVVIVGANGEARELAAMLGRNRGLGYAVVGFVRAGTAANGSGSGATLGSTEELLEILEQEGANSVIIASSGVDAADTNRVVRKLTMHGVHVELSSSLFDISADRLTVRPLGNFPVLYLEPVRRTGWRAGAKRAFDIAIAGTGLVVFAPVLALISLAIKLTSPGPVIFRQSRVGYAGEPFEMLKFRTMVAGADGLSAELRSLNEVDGPIFKMRNDPRITPVGRPLRSFSLDELPQLWNVLRGEMSIVGPRPALAAEALEWDTDFAAQRLSTRPGVTGMWQVSGRSDLSFQDYVRLDLYYVDNWSLWTDLAIVAKTVPTVLLRRGAC
jgi:exopolysaccharide biosynthesis polyprenyl glycosylphosphotransferase